MLRVPGRDVTKCIHKRVRDLEDHDIQALLHELERISGVHVSNHGDMMLIHFLQTCLYPRGGSEKQVPISKQDLDEHDPTDSFTLRKKIRLLTESRLYQVCRELAEMRGLGIEMVETQSLYVFLSRSLKLEEKRERTKIVRLRW
jgi:hypothetical protein